MTTGTKRIWTAGLLAIGVAACGTSDAGEARTLQTGAAELGSLRVTAVATGSIEPTRKVEVKSKASGEIVKLHVDVGDVVEPGALLAEVDPRDVQNAFEQAKADFEVSKARAEIAENQLARQEQLFEGGYITQQEMENARLDHSNARANLIKAQTNRDLAQLRLSDVTIRAPMAGTILEKQVEEGGVIQSASQNVSGGTSLFIMAALQQMQVRTLVDETDMGEIRAGMPATVSVEAHSDRAFEGVVEKIEPQAVVQQNVTMFPVIVTLDNQAGLLKPGMNAEVEILIDEATDVLLVPNSAVVLMQDVQPAAMTLGLDPESIDMSQFRSGRRFTGVPLEGAGAANGNGESDGARTADGGVASDAAPDQAGRRAAFDSLRARAERGEIPQDSLRSVLSGLRQGRAGGRTGRGGGFGDRAGSRRGDGGGAPRETLRAVVFVINQAGVPEPRAVEIGINDWDRTQVVSGLEAGEQVALIGPAQLQERQQEFNDRMRNRGGGMPFGDSPGRRGR